MGWKVLLLLLIIIGLVASMFGGEEGQKYINFLKDRAGKFLSGLLKIAPVETKEEIRGFPISLTADREHFTSQVYSATNSSFASSGICEDVRIGNFMLRGKEKRCTISVEEGSGQFEITAGGSVKISLESGLIAIDDFVYSATEERIKIDAEIVYGSGDTFNITAISRDEIGFTSITGELKKFREDGSPHLVISLEAEELRLGAFFGSLRLSDDAITLEGNVESIGGEGFSFGG